MNALYCRKCGAVLRDEKEFTHYDSSTGDRMYRVKSVCPNRRHWWDGHNGGFRDFTKGYVDFGMDSLWHGHWSAKDIGRLNGGGE